MLASRFTLQPPGGGGQCAGSALLVGSAGRVSCQHTGDPELGRQRGQDPAACREGPCLSARYAGSGREPHAGSPHPASLGVHLPGAARRGVPQREVALKLGVVPAERRDGSHAVLAGRKCSSRVVRWRCRVERIPGMTWASGRWQPAPKAAPPALPCRPCPAPIIQQRLARGHADCVVILAHGAAGGAGGCRHGRGEGHEVWAQRGQANTGLNLAGFPGCLPRAAVVLPCLLHLTHGRTHRFLSPLFDVEWVFATACSIARIAGNDESSVNSQTMGHCRLWHLSRRQQQGQPPCLSLQLGHPA